MYLRKWSRMHWWPMLNTLKKLSVPTVAREYPLIQRFPPIKIRGGSLPKKDTYQMQEESLINELFKKYPDLQYVQVRYSRAADENSQRNMILDFISLQRKYMKDGLTQEKAFEKAEEFYQHKFQEKIDNYKITHGLALNNKARSFLNVAEQYSELESRLKTERMQKNMPIYEKNYNKDLKEIINKNTLKSHSEQEEMEDELSQEEDIENQENNSKEEYHRVLHKIVPEASKDKGPMTGEKREKIANEFIANSKHMFKLYYERAAAFDKLSGLTEEEIMRNVRDSPTRIKKYTKQLLKKLHKYNIKLDNNGEVDYSECPHKNIIDKLKTNPLVKFALMQKDLDFEFPHLEAQKQIGKKIKAEFEEYETTKEKILGPPVEIKKEEIKKSEYEQTFKVEYPGEGELSEEEGETQKRKPTSDDNSLDFNPEYSFHFFESVDERRVRLEKKWLENRLASFDSGLEKVSTAEKMEMIGKAIEKLRRVKYLVDQEAVKNAKELFFKEHLAYTPEEFMIDNNTKLEDMSYYLRLPIDKRRITATLELDDDKIYKMIRRKEVAEDLVEPYTKEYNQILSEKDTEEYVHKNIETIRLEKTIRKISRDLELNDEPIDEEVDIEEGTEERVAQRKQDEKQKLMDYLKEQKTPTKEKKGNEQKEIEGRSRTKAERKAAKAESKAKSKD